MNEIIQNNLFSIILFLLFIIFLLLGVIVYVLYKLLNNKPSTTTSNEVNPQTTNFKKKSETSVTEKFYCQNHTETASAGSCLICEDVFCENCLIEHEGLYFCREHFKVFTNHKWKQITDVKTTPHTPEDGLFVWDFKRLLWKKDNIPTFVLTHYKINVESDFIESYVQLNVLEEHEDKLRAEIEKFKAKH